MYIYFQKWQAFNFDYIRKCRGLKPLYKRDVNEPFFVCLFFCLFVVFFCFFFFFCCFFCRFYFLNSISRAECLDITKDGFVLYTINVRKKGTLVCKKYCKTWKKSFCSRGVLEENRLNLNGDFTQIYHDRFSFMCWMIGEMLHVYLFHDTASEKIICSISLKILIKCFILTFLCTFISVYKSSFSAL